MARYTGPKHKIARREGVNLTGTTLRTLERRLDIPPGGLRAGRRKVSDYATSLRMKQRVKREYAMAERQFLRFLDAARKLPGPTGPNLLQLLERRLDNVVYRLGFAKTRPMARQLVSHRHVRVDDGMMNTPSYVVNIEVRISFGERAQQLSDVNDAAGGPVPKWLQREDSGGRVVNLPQREDSPADIQENLIVEFYAW